MTPDLQRRLRDARSKYDAAFKNAEKWSFTEGGSLRIVQSSGGVKTLTPVDLTDNHRAHQLGIE